MSLLFLFGGLANTKVAAQNFWEQTNGPYGGTVLSFVINANAHIFAGTNGGGIFRSADNGENWIKVNTGLTNTFVSALAINSKRHIFAGTRGGVFRSTNNGDTWTPANTGLGIAEVGSFAINSSGHIFAGIAFLSESHGGVGVFRSKNSGDSWEPVRTGLTSDQVWSLAINTSGHIFAGTPDGVFRSMDNGDTWTLVNTGLPRTSVWCLAINSSGHIFAGTDVGVFFSTNNGDTWTPINSGLPNTGVFSLAINLNEHIFAGTEEGIFRSTDNGNSWTPISSDLTSRRVYALAINPNGHIFAGTDGGVFRSSDDGGSWTPVNNGLISTYVRALAINSNGHIFAGTDGIGVFRSTNNGDIWTPINTGLTSTYVYPLAINANGHIFAGAFPGIVRSTDNGNSWESVNIGLPITGFSSLAINTSGYIFAGTYSYGVFRSTDNGDTWTPINNGLTNTDIRSLAINSNGHIFAGTFGGGAFRSVNNGDTWTPINGGLTANLVYALAINSSGHVFAGAIGGGVFRSSDNGDTWRRINTGLTNAQILALAINTSGYIFAGTYSSGVFRSTDNGDTWTPINTGLTNTDVRSLAITANGDVFAGTNGGGVFRAAHPVVKHTPPSLQEEGREIPIIVSISSETGIGSAQLSYRKGGDAKFDTVLMAETNGSYQRPIPPDAVTSRGVEYFIIATDLADHIKQEPLSGFFSVRVRVNGEGEMNRDAQGKSVPQPDGSEQSAYRLISVPLDLDNKNPRAVLEDDLGPYNIKKWRFYEFDADQNLHEFPKTIEMKPGRAFWLIVKEAGKVIDTGAGISNLTNKEYAIALHPGWNFIGNPFNFFIPTSNIHLKSNGESPTLRLFNENWNNPISSPVPGMTPFEGYAVYVSMSLGDTLFVDSDLSFSSNPLSKEESLKREKVLWSIGIQAQCQEARDVDNVAVVASSASIFSDEIDQPEPPVIGEYVSVYFPHRDWETLAKTYCTDARPYPTQAGEIWEFEVKTNIRDKVNLSFDGLESVPDEYEIWLIDEVVPVAQNLRQNQSYVVAASSPEHPKRLKLVVGKCDFVEEKIADTQVIPTTYELNQNFPNPFNPATTIRYGLPKAERVTLKIYNLLGEEVALIMNDELRAAGYHVAIWDGRNKLGEVVGSGVYIYRFRAGSFTAIKKMALVK